MNKTLIICSKRKEIFVTLSILDYAEIYGKTHLTLYFSLLFLSYNIERMKMEQCRYSIMKTVNVFVNAMKFKMYILNINSFMTEVSIIYFYLQDFCQWTSFYMIGASVMKEFNFFNLQI